VKIFCIGRNYAEHAKELNNEVPDEPVIFMKPATALLLENKPFFIPEFSQDIHHEIEVVIRISKKGKHIQEEFADRYFEQFSLGIDFTARDLQSHLKSKGLPWEKAKAFDHSAVLGKWLDKNDYDLNNLKFELYKNDTIVQTGNTSDMIFSFHNLIAQVSKYFTLEQGDLIYTGTPSGVSAVKPGDALIGRIGDIRVFSTDIK
jgi:acylpyruvate hydrolase